MKQAQVFNVADRTQASTYNREDDLRTIYVVGKGVQERINRQLLINEETQRRNAELTLVGLATGEGFNCNTIMVTG